MHKPTSRSSRSCRRRCALRLAHQYAASWQSTDVQTDAGLPEHRSPEREQTHTDSAPGNIANVCRGGGLEALPRSAGGGAGGGGAAGSPAVPPVASPPFFFFGAGGGVVTFPLPGFGAAGGGLRRPATKGCVTLHSRAISRSLSFDHSASTNRMPTTLRLSSLVRRRPCVALAPQANRMASRFVPVWMLRSAIHKAQQALCEILSPLLDERKHRLRADEDLFRVIAERGHEVRPDDRSTLT